MARSKKTATSKTKEVKSNVVNLWAEENPAEFHVESAKAAEENWISNKDIENAAKKVERNDGKIEFQVHKKAGWFIRTQAYRNPVPMYKLPQDLQQYLLNKGFWTNVWEKDKAWLKKHKADPKMIEKLKAFISGNYL